MAENLNHLMNPNISTSTVLPPKYSGPFKATQFLKNVSTFLRENLVTDKKKRAKTKYSYLCFCGSVAVDIVLEFLTQEKEHLPNRDINRAQAVKLCSTMIEMRVLEPVEVSANIDRHVFEDSPSQLYCFLEDFSKENVSCKTKADEARLAVEIEKFKNMKCDRSANRVQQAADTSFKSVDSGYCPLTSSTPARGVVSEDDCSSESSQSKKSNFTSFVAAVSSTASIRKAARKFKNKLQKHKDDADGTFENVADEVWREEALSHLLTIIDVPVLEQILSYDTTPTHPLTITNVTCHNSLHASITVKTERIGSTDPWFTAALDLIDHIPNSSVYITQCLGLTSCGLDRSHVALDADVPCQLYRYSQQHYTRLPRPLWTCKFEEVHLAILKLILEDKKDLALKATQLSLMLLPVAAREELLHLLLFMKLTAEGAVLGTGPEGTEKQVLQVFSPAVLRSAHILAPHQVSLLVTFLLRQADMLGECPQTVKDSVRKRIDEQKTEAPPVEEHAAAAAFCDRITPELYNKQTTTATDQGIVDVVNAIIDDKKMTAKDKKAKLKAFNTAYPEIFQKHFSNILVYN